MSELTLDELNQMVREVIRCEQAQAIIEAAANGTGVDALTPAQCHYLAAPDAKLAQYIENGLLPWMEQGAFVADARHRAELWLQITEQADLADGQQVAAALAEPRPNLPAYLMREIQQLQTQEEHAA